MGELMASSLFDIDAGEFRTRWAEAAQHPLVGAPVDSSEGPHRARSAGRRLRSAARHGRTAAHREKPEVRREKPRSAGASCSREDAGPGLKVRARTALHAESVAGVAGARDSAAAERIRALWRAGREEARTYGGRLRMAAAFASDLEADDPTRDPDEDDVDIMAVAVALRMSTDQAERLIRDGHAAVQRLPSTLQRLCAGEMPAAWFMRLLRSTRQLPAAACALVDERIAAWDLESIPVARFRRELRLLIAWVSARVDPSETASPESMRSVDLADVDPCTGTARLEVTGPIPEILSLAHRLDESARALQRAQRHALERGSEVPFDIDGAASERAQPLSLRALRYALLTRTVFETDGVEVPSSRFRLNVTVPMLTLLGASDAPGVVEGEHPLPAEMARALAAGESIWYRILTDPATGIHLPTTADSYRPSAQMQEHLRLRHPVCAAPGCTRSTTRAAEVDHIEEFDHDDPSAGGLTELENLHLLCWRHHQLKTARRIDPIRARERIQPRDPSPDRRSAPGSPSGTSAPPGLPDSSPGSPPPPTSATHWRLPHGIEVLLEDARDLFAPDQVAILQAAWAQYQQLTRIREENSATGVADPDAEDGRGEGADWSGEHAESVSRCGRYSEPPPY